MQFRITILNKLKEPFANKGSVSIYSAGNSENSCDLNQLSKKTIDFQNKSLKLLCFGFFICILSIAVTSCEMFSTRSPEKPDVGNTSFLPPTEPSIVILNFETALKEKNIENYMNCFHTFSDVERLNFQFTPSAEAITKFSSIFTEWGSAEERRSFNSIVAALGEERYPKVTWINRKPMQETADSAIFTTDYYLQAPNSDNAIPDEFAGRLQFTLTFRDNGLWYISRWIDFNAQVNDSVNTTWSVLKGYYYN